MAREASVRRANARDALRASARDGALSKLRVDPERTYFTLIVAVACAAAASYGTYRFLTDDYEMSFERNLRHMSRNVVECVQSRRLLNLTGPIPACVDPVNGKSVTVDVAVLPPAAVSTISSAKPARANVKQTSAAAGPKVSPLIFSHASGKRFYLPGHDAPLSLKVR